MYGNAQPYHLANGKTQDNLGGIPIVDPQTRFKFSTLRWNHANFSPSRLGGHSSSSDHCEEYPRSHVVLRRSSDIRGPLPWNAAADAVAAVGVLEQVCPAAALGLSGAIQWLAEGL